MQSIEGLCDAQKLALLDGGSISALPFTFRTGRRKINLQILRNIKGWIHGWHWCILSKCVCQWNVWIWALLDHEGLQLSSNFCWNNWLQEQTAVCSLMGWGHNFHKMSDSLWLELFGTNINLSMPFFSSQRYLIEKKQPWNYICSTLGKGPAFSKAADWIITMWRIPSFPSWF